MRQKQPNTEGNCFLLSLLTAFFCLPAFAQGQSEAEETEDATNVAKVTFLNPGFGYELCLGRYQVLHAQAYMNLSACAENSGASNLTFRFYFDPAVTLQYRYYYNGAKRLENGKRIAKNSMNYVAVVGDSYFSKIPLTSNTVEEESRRPVHRVGLVWGLQRNFEKHFSLDLNVGPGLLSSTGHNPGQTRKVSLSQGTLMGQLNLGFWFGGK